MTSPKVYHEREYHGVCPQCGKDRDTGYTWCSDCRAKYREHGKTYRETHAKALVKKNRRRRAEHREMQLCPICGNYTGDTPFKLCQSCRDKCRVHNTNRRMKMKLLGIPCD